MTGGQRRQPAPAIRHFSLVSGWAGPASLHSLIVEPVPVFADPSGRRRRVFRRVGLALAAALAACLSAVVVALAGGPQAPFTHWAAPPAPEAAVRHGGTAHRPGTGGSAGNPSSPGPQAGPVPSSSASPTPRTSTLSRAVNEPFGFIADAYQSGRTYSARAHQVAVS